MSPACPSRVCVALLLVVAFLALPGIGRGDDTRVEAVGAVAVENPGTERRALRDEALQAGIAEAVRQVALDLLVAGGRMSAMDAAAAPLNEILGPKPLDYTTRFRILEDYGERQRIFVQDSPAETEYVVLVEANVDTERVRTRLTKAGLVSARSDSGARHPVWVVLESLDSYRALAWIRTALVEEAGASAALPVEIQPGRVVLVAQTPLESDAVLDRLLAAAPEDLRILPLRRVDETLVLQVIARPQESQPAAGSRD